MRGQCLGGNTARRQNAGNRQRQIGELLDQPGGKPIEISLRHIFWNFLPARAACRVCNPHERAVGSHLALHLVRQDRHGHRLGAHCGKLLDRRQRRCQRLAASLVRRHHQRHHIIR